MVRLLSLERSKEGSFRCYFYCHLEFERGIFLMVLLSGIPEIEKQDFFDAIWYLPFEKSRTMIFLMLLVWTNREIQKQDFFDALDIGHSKNAEPEFF
jgi:hypothetical protein